MTPDISKLSELLVDTDKEVWGKVFWSILHRVGADSGLTNKWLEEFTEAIVCPFCRAHFKELLRLCPRSCAPDDFTYTWILHNLVNARINRPVMGFEEAKSLYS